MRAPGYRFRALGAVLVTGLLGGACALAGSSPDGPGQPVASASGDAQRIPVGEASYVRLAPPAFSAMLRTTDALLINVHVPYDGEIDGTDLFIPFDQVARRTADLPPKDEPILLYCRTGRMSAIAAATLAGLGYTSVTELGGGMDAWRAAGLPLRLRPPG